MEDTSKSPLNQTFGGKSKGSQISYGHPHSKSLIDSAYEVIAQSETGRLLLKLIDFNKVPVHVLKGTGQSGFSPELMTIYMQAPGNMTGANGAFIINLIKALDEAGQELAGFKTPDPAKDIMAYAGFVHGRNLDSLTQVCKIVKELTNSAQFTNLIDSLTELGLNGVYKAYLAGESREMLYEQYAVAYESMNRGS